jgi:ABC-type multidrug transport system permease subunit
MYFTTGAQNIIGVLFFICIQLTFGYVMPTLATFIQQRQIIRRELASGAYGTAAAYTAKIISQMPLVLLSTALFALPVYWMIGLYAGAAQYFTFLAIIVVHALASSMLGIMVSSGVSNVRIGQIIGPMIIVVFLIFGGQFVNADSTPIFLRWIRWVSLINYSYSALAQNELNNVQFDCGGVPTCTADGKQVLAMFDLDDVPLWYCVLINALMGVAYLIIGYILFRWRSKPLLKLK